MCCRKGWGSPFDQEESNGADVQSVGFGFWLIRTHDLDRARGRGHQPQFSGHTAFVSEPCAVWKHLHYLTSYFCSNENMSSSFRLQFFSTVRNHNCTLWFYFLLCFTRRQASLSISNYEYAKKRSRLYVYIYSRKYTCVLARSFLCCFASFLSLCEKREKTSDSSAIGCGQRRRPCWYFNFRNCI